MRPPQRGTLSASKTIFLIVFLLVLLSAGLGSCFGTMAAVRSVVGTEKTWVYEECDGYWVRGFACRTLEKPRLEEHTPNGEDFWAGIAVFFIVVSITGGILLVVGRRLKIIDEESVRERTEELDKRIDEQESVRRAWREWPGERKH